MKIKKENNGFSHPLVFVLIIVVIAAIAGAGYFVWKKQNDKGSSSKDSVSSETTLSAADVKQLKDECDKKYNDEDLCKFLSNWGTDKKYQMYTTSTLAGTSTQLTMELDGDNTYSKAITTDGTIETITIGKTTYTKDPSDGSWWKQTSESTSDNSSSTTTNTTSPVDTSEFSEIVDTTSYKLITKEACDNIECFKYEVVDTSTPSDKQYIWFDTKDHKLRRWQMIFANGDGSDTTVAYDSKSIEEPSPTKDVPAGAYVGPNGILITMPDTNSVPPDSGDSSGNTPSEEYIEE